MNFKPLKDIVLIEPIEEKISSILEIPESAEASYKNARVLAIGPVVKKNGNIKINDIILLPHYGTIEVTLDGKNYKLIHEEDILAVVT